MAKRRHKLEDSLRWHQYNFDANSELQWIQEHMPAATSTDYGKNLIDAQNLSAKHKVRARQRLRCNIQCFQCDLGMNIVFVK